MLVKPSEVDIPQRRKRRRGESDCSAMLSHDSQENCLSQNHCDHGADTSDTEPRSLETLCLRKTKLALIGSTSDK